jgi:hypothetical protein
MKALLLVDLPSFLPCQGGVGGGAGARVGDGGQGMGEGGGVEHQAATEEQQQSAEGGAGNAEVKKLLIFRILEKKHTKGHFFVRGCVALNELIGGACRYAYVKELLGCGVRFVHSLLLAFPFSFFSIQVFLFLWGARALQTIKQGTARHVNMYTCFLASGGMARTADH